jgi:hypothetical protein
VALTLEQIQSAYDMGANGIGFYDYPAYFNGYSAGDRQQINNLLENLAPPPPPLPLPPGKPGVVLDDFEADEGHFLWPYNTSPVSQTNGLSSDTTIERVTGEGQGSGASQELHLVPETAGGLWNLRHNSGIGALAHPDGNVHLEPTGWVGFWMKTDDPGMQVQIGVDDPVGNTALERGVPLDVVADGMWHLYQWNFEEADHWHAFAGGANGQIDAASGFVTVDSIWLSGAGEALLFLDTVSHNPEGPLTAAGDFNGDGVVDSGDLNAWIQESGSTGSAQFGDGDADADGDVDGGDFLAWQRTLGLSNALPSSSRSVAAAVPEPAAALLTATVGLAALVARQVRFRSL